MRYSWPVSTGRSGYGTPSGVFYPQAMARRHFSRRYYNSPMPHSIFFYYGFAIHGTTDIYRLGGPASHGCVRLHPSHAAALYALVERNGPRNTRIEISNEGLSLPFCRHASASGESERAARTSIFAFPNY
jgi:lipoprotein-anchoring transpeptidase ErfK/SrfK